MSKEDKVPLRDELEARAKELSDALVADLDARNAKRSEFEARKDASDEDRAAFEAEEEAFNADFDKRESEIKAIEKRARQEKRREKALEAAAKAARGTKVEITNEPLTYREDNAGEISYFLDIALTDPRIGQHMEGSAAPALDRLQRHAKETETWLPKRAQQRERAAEKAIDEAERAFSGSFVPGLYQRRGLDASPFERRVNPSRTTGQGGYFVPPLWLIDSYLPGLRAGRVAAGLCRQMPLPPGTDSINIPKLSTLTLVGVQQSDGSVVPSQDFTDTSVQANVKTLAGQEDVAIQLIEQSPGQIIDQVIMQDLLADYNRLVDRQVLFSPGTNASQLGSGQIQGIYPASNWSANQVTWTSASPVGGGFHAVLNANASRIAYNRFDITNVHHVLHPRRWFWYASAMDGASGTSGRPLVEPNAFGPFNVAALEAAGIPFEGLVGRVGAGQNVYIDGNVPTNDNGSGVQSGTFDLAVTAKWDDLWLFEGDLRTRVLPEILSGTLQIRYQVYNYVAFLVRYGQSITLAQGTGFGAPASAFDSSVTF